MQRARYLADFAGRDKDKLIEWRRRWADVCNAHLKAHGIDERIDQRSNAERGICLLPTVHESYAVRAIEDREKRKVEKEGREYVPVTERRRINEARRAATLANGSLPPQPLASI